MKVKFRDIPIVLFFVSAVIISVIIFLGYEYIKWTDSNLEYFVSYLKNRPVKIPFWLSTVLVLLTNVCTLVFNIICEIVKL